MKNIFTKTLTLIAFLSLSAGVWGADNIPSSLSFDWNSYGNGTSLSGTSSDKVILDGDFEWSGVGENNLKHSSGYCLFKGDDVIEVAQSRQKYTFQKGTYQVEIACMVKEDKKFYTPIVVVDQNTWNKSYETHPSTYTTSNPEKKWTETLEIVVPAAGDYYVRAQFKSTGDEKCGVGQISFTYKGGGTTYALTLTNDGHGSAVSDQADNSAISEDTEVTITATPNTGYKFVNWTGSSTETNNPFTFTMDAAKNYQANFAQAKQVTITIAAGAHGRVDETGGTYAEGTQITVTATADNGYEFAQWDDGNTNNPRTITVDESKLSYTASFRKQTKVCTNTLTWEAEDENALLKLNISGKVDPLTAYTLKTDAGATPATASPNYIAIGDGSHDRQRLCYAFEISEATTCSLTVRSKTSKTWDLSAKFELWATNMSGDDHFEYNGDTYNKALKDQSFKVYQSWKEDTKSLGTLVAGKYILAIGKDYQPTDYDYFTITASANVFCTEVPATGYEITKGTHTGGDFTIKVDNEDVTEADAGTTITLAVSSTETCKEFSAWDVYETDNSSNKVTVTNNTFEMPEFDVTVDATFATKTYTISYELGSTTLQTISPFDVTCGNAWNAPSVTPVYGWRQVAWHKNAIDGETVTSGVWIPTEATTLYLEWAEDLSTEWNLQGTFFNDWQLIAMSKQTGHSAEDVAYVTQHIDAGSYLFKFYRSNGNYDIGSTISIGQTTTGFTMCSNNENSAGLEARVSGDYIFKLDWSSSFECPTIDITFPDFYTITFDANGHTTLDPLNDGYAVPGGKVARPTDPRVHNWAFGGWYETPACDGSQFNFNTAINSDKVLYAKWTYSPEQYYYHENGGDYAEGMTLSSDGYFYHIGKAKQNDNRWFKIQSLNKWYGYEQNRPGYNYSNLTNMNSNDNKWNAGENISAINERNNDYFIIVYIPGTPFNEGANPIICASTVLTKNMGDDHKIFFEATDNGAGKWKTPHFRIGRGNNNSSGKNNSATAFLIVPGTDALYYCNSPIYGNYEEFTIANSAGWQGDNSIYQPSETKPTGDYEITHLLSYKGSIPVCEDITYVPATSGSYVSDQGCTYYDYTTTKGMKTQQVTNNGGEHGTVTISFVDVVKDFTGNTTVSDFTSGVRLVAQTCKLTITATPEEGYELATNGLVVTGATLKNGQYVVNGTTTVSATFVSKTYAITLDKNNNDAAGSTSGSATATYDSNTLTNITHVTARTGYTLSGYFTAATDGTKVINANGTLVASVDGYTDTDGSWVKDDDCTLYAQWTINQHTLTWNTNGDELTGDYTHGTVDYGTTITAPNTPTKTGYTFAGWSDGSSVVTPATTMPDNDVTYTATWNIITYTITYHDATTTNPTEYNITSSFDLSNPSSRTGFTFLGWYTDAQYTNSITAITPGMHEDKDIYAKWENAYCSNTFTIQCEENRIEPTGGTGKPSNLLVIDDDGDMYYTNAHSNDGVHYYVDLKGSTGEIYYFVHLPAATYDFDVYLVNSGSTKVRLYSPNGTGSKTIQWNSTSYKQVNTEDNWGVSNGASGEYASFAKSTISNKTLEDGDYIISLRTDNSWAAFDQIVITANSKVFCPEMYTVTFPQPTEGQGTVTAQIKNGAAINSGDEVPEGTEVIFTWNEASGYDFVNFYDGTNTYTQNPCTLTVNSNLTITTTVEVEVTKHLLTVNAGENGSVSPTSQEVGENREVTITATPDSHYGFASWTAVGITLTDEQQKQNPLTITMPTNDVTLTASFEYVYVDAMIVTGNNAETGSNGSDNGGEVTPTSVADPNDFFDHNVWEMSYEMPSNAYAGIRINRDAGYTPASSNGATGFGFYYMTEPGQTIAFCLDPRGQQSDQRKTQLPSTNGFWKYAFVESNLASNWEHSYIIIYQNATDNANGSWTPNTLPGSGGTTTTPATGKYYIAEICATERTTKPEETPVYTATFAANPSDKATVTATVDAAAIASGDAVDAGKSITFDYSNLEANYRFDGWTATGISLTDEQKQQHPLTITMPSASITLTANFVRVYTLVVGKDANIASVTGAGQYAAGESVTVTATAKQGYKFTKWTEGAGGSELATTSSYTFDMPVTDNYTVYANSEQDITYYQITLGPCTNGTIAATVGGLPYEGTDLTANTPVVLTATPADGYGFVQWKDGSRENPHIIYANAETEGYNPWTATFDQIYTVTTEFGKPGSEVIGGGTYPIGGQVTLEAFVSDKDYELDYNFSHWEKVSGTAPITGHEHDNPLTFTMPAQNLTLKAIYAPVECVDNFVIQCEDDQAYIPWNRQGENLDLTKYPNSIPHDGQCGPYHDYYNGYHGTGYYDYKSAKSAEMYYPIELPASTYKFEIWSASNGDKNCWMNLYIESDDPNPEVVYKGVNYKKTSSVTANNNCGAAGNFAISGTIDNVVLSSPKSVIIGLYCGEDYGSFDQIVITADADVFCHELPTDLFVINSNETKEIPVCGVDNLVIYDGGQANNEENVEVKTSVKHIRQVKQLDVWEDFALPFTATSIQVEDPDDHNMYDIYPAVLQYNEKTGWTVKAGYFVLEELKHEEMDTVIGTKFRQRWEMTINEKPQENIPYIIEFTSTQSDGYFLNTFITYGKTGPTDIIGYDNAIVNNGSWPQDGTKPTFHYVANNAVVPVVPYDAYVLSKDHTMFELKEQPTIMPFHCYIQASAETKAKAPRLMLSGGGGTPTTLVPIYMDAEHQNYKVMIDEVIYVVREGKIYTVMGQLVK